MQKPWPLSRFNMHYINMHALTERRIEVTLCRYQDAAPAPEKWCWWGQALTWGATALSLCPPLGPHFIQPPLAPGLT